MKLLRRSSEDEFIAVFLRAEIDSERYGPMLRTHLDRGGHGIDVLRRPDIADERENAYRRRLLDDHRAYGPREGLFDGFPEELDWYRARLTRDEVLDILFIDWDWWLRLSGGTRRPRDAARRIRAGEAPGATAEGHEPVAAGLAADGHSELIAVTNPAHSPLVLVEGHVRLTAYALFPDRLPSELEILLGVSDEIAGWCQF
jgi:hypothetical protein